MRNKILYILGAAAAVLIARNVYLISGLPGEESQGAIFKIIFFHVPLAITAFVCGTVACVASILYLIKKDMKYDTVAVSVTEVGLAFLAGNLITGSIWARVIWGIWWAWDVRLTSALVCWILYASYLMIRHAVEEPTQRANLAAVVSIFAFLDIPIVILSIRLFRTQHPGPVFLSSTGSFPHDCTMIIFGPLGNQIALLMLAAVMTMVRLGQEQAQREIYALRREAHAF
jgi:heme exporter protein C